MDVLGLLRALVGAALVAYLPGRAWVDVLIPTLRTRLERFAFSVGLSVSMVVLSMYVINVGLGIRVTTWSVALTSLLLAGSGFGTAYLLRRRRDARVPTGTRNEAP